MPNAANRIFGSIDGNFDRSAGAVSRISEDTYILSCLYFSYTPTRLIPYRRFQVDAPGRREKNQRDHDAILDAILASDRELAFALMRAHSADQDAALFRMIACNETVAEGKNGGSVHSDFVRDLMRLSTTT